MRPYNNHVTVVCIRHLPHYLFPVVSPKVAGVLWFEALDDTKLAFDALGWLEFRGRATHVCKEGKQTKLPNMRQRTSFAMPRT